MKRIFTLFLFTIITLAVKGQIVVNLNAAKDNTIYSENTNSNGIGEHFFAGKTATGDTRRALIQFNLATIPPGSTITSVTLTLYGTRVLNNSGIAVHKLSQNWGEGTSNAGGSEGMGISATTNDATWIHSSFPSSNWSTTGGSFSGTVSASVPTVVAGINNMVDGGLIADVQGFVNNSATNFGWMIRGTETRTATAIRFGTKDNLNVSFRPVLNVTYSSPLPVTLTSFKATLQNQNTLLTWKTATEINNNYFIVEHSDNGTVFKSIGKVQGSGSSSIERTYAFVHNSASTGKNYYRLAQYDINGTVKYSPIVLANKTLTNNIKIGPNPASNIINISNNQFNKEGTFKITSANGKLVKTGAMVDQTIQISDLLRGIYFLTLMHENEVVFSGSFIKK